MQNQHSYKDTLAESVFLFLMFGFIGWLYEVSLAFLYGYGYINRGFLFGPYLPLYGFGALLLIACLQKMMKRSIKIGKLSITPIIVFLLVMLITTAVEYVVGYLLELIFHQRWWDYSTYKYQLHGRICLSATLRFGLGGMVFLYVLTPLFRRVFDKIPRKTKRLLACVIVGLLLLDFVVTLISASVSGFNPQLAQPR